MIEIVNIKNSLKDLNEVMDMTYLEWGKFFKKSKEEKTKKILEQLNKNSPLPQIFVMKENNKVVGSFSIKEEDLEDCNLSPWLACVIIKKEYRSKGYGKRLLEYIKTEIEQNYPLIYLFTTHTNFYEKIGFEYVKDVMHGGEVNRSYVKKSSN